MSRNSRIIAVVVVALSACIFPALTCAGVFGDQTAYSSQLLIGDAIYALKGIPAEPGLCDSITCFVKFNFDSCKVRCALYERVGNDTVLVANGVTEQRQFGANGSFTWQGFAFTGAKPSIQAGADYFIAVTGDTAGRTSGGLPRLAGLSSGGILINKLANYESGFPASLHPATAVLNFRASVYCTFSPQLLSPRRRHSTMARFP